MGGLLAKPDTQKQTEDGAGKSGGLAYGVSAMQGWRKAMEDAHLALPDFDPERKLGLFGVFDGHGGAAVSRVASEQLPVTLRSLPAFREGRYEEALKEAFLQVDAYLDSPEGRKRVKELADQCPDESESEDEEDMIKQLIASGDLDPKDLEAAEEEAEEDEEGLAELLEGKESEEEEEEEEEEGVANSAWANGEGPDGMGTTAVVALVRGGENPEVYCANAGDSRCVLARGTKAVNMSRDHKPTLKCERNRIKKAGGFVTAEGRVDGNLNLSRAFGDFAYKKDKSLKPVEQKISCEAEVRRVSLSSADEYLLIGCDGIFEKASSQALVDFMMPQLRARERSGGARRKAAPASLSAACSVFLDHNVAKNPSQEEGLGCDNMTLMAVKLSHGAAGSPAGAGARDAAPKKARRRLGRAVPNGKRFSARRSISKSRRRERLLQWASRRGKKSAA